MTDIALGVVVLTRVEKLRNLLNSIEQKEIGKVYVADNGKMTSDKETLYNKEFPFEFEVLDLEYDIGLGYSRDRIVKAFDEDYLLIVDNDHELPDNVMVLADQLAERPDIGGIAGSVIEPERGRLWQSAKDFYEVDNELVRDARYEGKEIEFVSGSPFVEFDFVPNAAMFRSECIQDYSWDSEYPLGRAHADFYLGHWKNTEWSFGISPEVMFSHYPGGDTEYVSHRRDTEKYEFAENYFLDKWGYEDFRTEEPYWYDTHYQRLTLLERARRIHREDGAKALMNRGIKKVVRTARQNILER
jgi:hypothetical protein